MAERVDQPEGRGLVLSPLQTVAASREDDRPRLLEPPPVLLVAVQDAQLSMVAGLERELDAFYRDLLGFERLEQEADMGEGPVYRAQNHDLRFRVTEVPDDRQGCRLLRILTPRYSHVAQQLSEADAEFEIVRGIFAGNEELITKDPAGNWVAVVPLVGAL